MKDVLIIDDEPAIGETLGDLLRRAGFSSDAATDRAGGLAMLDGARYRSLLLDLRMPGVEGLDLLKEVVERHPRLPVIMITAHATIKTAVEAVKRGAFDFITKPIEKEELLTALRKALRQSESDQAPEEIRWELPSQGSAVFRDPKSVALAEEARRAAGVDLPALITGESGVGKEVFARLLHECGPRKGGPFVKVNCAAIPEPLFESDLFGHERGAFTGAVVSKPGRVEIANGGTLFLDEIGELPKSGQAKMLQFLQDRTYERVGGVRTLKSDVRVVAATLRKPEEVLREDLAFRLSGVTIHVPPLRERRGDVEPLALRVIAASGKRVSLAPGTLEALRSYEWPGNVRELEHRLMRAIALCKEGVLHAADVLPVPPKTGGLRDERKEFEKGRVTEALRETKGNRTEAAKRLGLSRRMLQKKLKEFGID